MLKLITSSIAIIGVGIGFDHSDLERDRFKINVQTLTSPSSPTLDLDPWELYENKKYQEISDKILEQEINRWEE